MHELSSNGYRCIGYDQRGCGRSDQAWNGNDIDCLAGDLASVIDQLQLTDVTLVGHSMGCAVICQYLSQYQRQTSLRPQPGRRLFNRKSKHSAVSDEMMDWAVIITQEATLRAAIELQSTSFSTDQREEVKKIQIPILLQHGDCDVTSPLPLTAEKTRDPVPNSRLIVYQHHGHGLLISDWNWSPKTCVNLYPRMQIVLQMRNSLLLGEDCLFYDIVNGDDPTKPSSVENREITNIFIG